MEPVTDAEQFAPVHLVVSEDDFLAERACKKILKDLKKTLPHGTDIPVTKIKASETSTEEISELCSPSLFGEDRIVIVTNIESGARIMDTLLSCAKDPAPGVVMILVVGDGKKQKASVTKLKKLAHVHNVPQFKKHELGDFVTDEFRRQSVRVSQDVVHAILDGVGSNLRELAGAVTQLVTDTDGAVTEEAVRAYYIGIAEVDGFDIAEAALSGKTKTALASVRRALQIGVKEMSIVAALENKIGLIARCYDARGRGAAQDLARELGMAPWMVERAMRLAGRWDGDAVSQAVVIIADLDAAVKGQSAAPDYAVEDAIRRLSELPR